MRYLYLLLMLTLFVGCSENEDGGGGDLSGDLSGGGDETAISIYSLADLIDSEGDEIDGSLFISDGSAGVSITIDEATNLPTRAMVLTPSIADGKSVTIEFNESGQPTLITLDGSYIAIGNHSGTTVDISAVNSLGETLALTNVETSVNWDEDIFSSWSDGGSLVQSRNQFVDGLVSDFKLIGIGVAYGLKSAGDFYTLFTSKDFTLSGWKDRFDAVGGIVTNLSDAIVTAIPEAKDWVILSSLVSGDATDDDLLDNLADLKDLLGGDMDDIIEMLANKLTETSGEYLADKLTNATDIEAAIAALGTGEDASSDSGSGGSTDGGNTGDTGTGGGSITDGYIEISTPAELYNVRNNLTANYIVMKDIDLSGYDNWDPIGGYSSNNEALSFTGIFDGGGYKIKGLKINETSDYVGLFTAIRGDDAVVRNVIIENPSINNTGEYFTAALVGYAKGDVLFENCGVIGGSVSGVCCVGGIIGALFDSDEISIKECYNLGTTITSEYTNIGGIVGQTDGSVAGCFNTGNVSSGGGAGGITGGATSSSQIILCYNTGEITGVYLNNFFSGSTVGGVAGSASSVTGCFNSGMVSGVDSSTIIYSNQTSIGSVVGNGSGFTACYYVSGTASAGVGTTEDSPNITATSIAGINTAVETMNQAAIDAGYSDYCFVAGALAESALPCLSYE